VLDSWNVQAFPMVYVIDAGGVIRHRNLHGDELNKAVEALVKEAETKAKDEEKTPAASPASGEK
jgi:hypothetical protein